MKIEELRAKVAASEQRVEKCKKTIERHTAQLEKKANELRKIGINPETTSRSDFTANNSSVNHEVYWLFCDYEGKKDDIKGATQKLADAERVCAGWKEKLDIEINKEKIIQDTVPDVIKDFLEKWKADAFDWYVQRFDAFLEFRKNLRSEERAARLEAYYILPEYTEIRERYKSFLGDKDPDDSSLINIHPRKPMEEFLKERDLDYKTINERLKNFGDNIIFRMLNYHNVDERLNWLNKTLEEEKKHKLIALIDSITYITGPITDAKHLYASAGDLNGVIVGEKGVAKIITISAGGYNIQCFHYRTRVSDVTEKYKDDPALFINNKEEKRYYVNEDYPSQTWEDILGLTTETARRVLNDEEFTRWYKERNERFPGCYQPLEYWMADSRVCTYQFPRFEGGDDEVAKDYGLVVVANIKDDTIVKGQYRDILAFADKYLGYQLVPEYLKDVVDEKPRLDDVIGRCASEAKAIPSINVKDKNKERTELEP